MIKYRIDNKNGGCMMSGQASCYNEALDGIKNWIRHWRIFTDDKTQEIGKINVEYSGG